MDGIFAFKSCKDRTVIRIQGKNIKESLSFHTVFKGNSQEAAARLIEKGDAAAFGVELDNIR